MYSTAASDRICGEQGEVDALAGHDALHAAEQLGLRGLAEPR